MIVIDLIELHVFVDIWHGNNISKDVLEKSNHEVKNIPKEINLVVHIQEEVSDHVIADDQGIREICDIGRSLERFGEVIVVWGIHVCLVIWGF